MTDELLRGRDRERGKMQRGKGEGREGDKEVRCSVVREGGGEGDREVRCSVVREGGGRETER